MKKSNKLLVGGFLALLLFITAIHVTLYAKYKSGDYTDYHTADLTPQSSLSFPHVLFVTLRDIPAATVTLGDSTRVEKNEEAGIQYVQKGDTLLITGNPEQADNLQDPLSLQLPSNASLSVSNSSLSIVKGKNNVVNNTAIDLTKSSLLFSATKNSLSLGQVKIVARDSSSIAFKGNTNVNLLDVQLANSSIEYGEGEFGQLSILTDSLSRLSLQSKHLLKANIKTVSHQ